MARSADAIRKNSSARHCSASSSSGSCCVPGERLSLSAEMTATSASLSVALSAESRMARSLSDASDAAAIATFSRCHEMSAEMMRPGSCTTTAASDWRAKAKPSAPHAACGAARSYSWLVTIERTRPSASAWNAASAWADRTLAIDGGLPAAAAAGAARSVAARPSANLGPNPESPSRLLR